MKIFSMIDDLLTKKDKIVIGIDGPSGSGKTTLSSKLLDKYKCSIFHTDDYFLSEEAKKSVIKTPGWNLDYSRMKEEVFNNLGNSTLVYRPFNCRTQSFDDPVNEIIKEIVIIEGVYSHNPYFDKMYDIKVFIDIDKELQQERILKRNGQMMLDRWNKEWIPLENEYFEHFNIKKQADIIIKL